MNVIDFGLLKYESAWKKQIQVHEQVVQDGIPSVIFVEHPAVLTFGKNADATNLLFSKGYYLDKGIELYETDRGGDVTAHMPGQMVVYPIIPVTKLNLSVKKYIFLLEQTVIDLLSMYGIKASRDAEFPGVWVGFEKICAVGVRIKDRVSMHGIALNINNDLDIFGSIVPCGIKFRGVTSMGKLLQASIETEIVKKRFVEIFCSHLKTGLAVFD